jgi:hypothetical protein
MDQTLSFCQQRPFALRTFAGSGTRALVAFQNQTEVVWLRLLLRRGYRHCFCLVGHGTEWILCDPLLGRVSLSQISGLTEAALARVLMAQGMTVLLGDLADDPRRRRGCLLPSLRPLTCVEVVKRILRVDAPLVLTPAQLHAELLRPDRPGGAFLPVASATMERLDHGSI